jgi:hypothetical protein
MREEAEASSLGVQGMLGEKEGTAAARDEAVLQQLRSTIATQLTVSPLNHRKSLSGSVAVAAVGRGRGEMVRARELSRLRSFGSLSTEMYVTARATYVIIMMYFQVCSVQQQEILTLLFNFFVLLLASLCLL